MGYSPWGLKESDKTEHTHSHVHTYVCNCLTSQIKTQDFSSSPEDSFLSPPSQLHALPKKKKSGQYSELLHHRFLLLPVTSWEWSHLGCAFMSQLLL